MWVWKRQHLPKRAKLFSDSDWTGCLTTRRSSSCTVWMLGQHCIAVSSTTQLPISLSSGEAEFYALAKTCSRAIGATACYVDFGYLLTPPQVLTDSASAKGTASRRGCGNIRHLETPTLWVQQAVYRKRLELSKVDGKANPSDIGTKMLDRTDVEKCMRLMAFVFLEGRSTALPSAV